MSVSALAQVNSPIRVRGPYPFDLRNLNRLIGRGGRIADTHNPIRYAAVLRRLLRQFGNSLRYGFMLPVNVLLDGIVDHAIYHEPRVPQLTAMAIFRQQYGLWRVRAVLAVRGDAPDESAMSEKLAALYGDFGVELVVLTPEMIDGGYLQIDEFAERLNQAVFSHENIPPRPPTPACRIAAA
jgi:hypothetical protein